MKSAAQFFRWPPVAQERTDRLAETVAEADRAQQFIEDPIVAAFFAKQEEALIERMIAFGVGEDLERYRLAVALQTVRQLREFLRRSAESGRVARKQLEALERGPSRYF